MKIYSSIDDFPTLKNAVVTTGTFDGVHVGHRRIIQQLHDIAETIDGETVLLTFWPHPRMVLFDDQDLRLINTQREKEALLAEAGVDHLIVHPFTKQFSRLTAMEYVRDVLVNRIGTKKLVIGYDHHFGRNREGSFDDLVEFGHTYHFDVEEIPAQVLDNVSVSSTKVRNALLEGDVSTANEYLGSTFELTGKVVRGATLGRTLDFPTANIEVPEKYKLIPADGVYAVEVRVGNEWYKGMSNIGKRPTVSGQDRQIEAHIFEFDKSIYDQLITLRFHKRLRDEQKFGSLEELKAQLHRDEESALKVLLT
ncbi:MAG: bifunctional riboflavin kinase/FAD synthetase [Flavobacteriales bacterium]|nr:bifunctional riboflavin kinase/FAD synthetase [Flavobacteriales bacterium]